MNYKLAISIFLLTISSYLHTYELLCGPFLDKKECETCCAQHYNPKTDPVTFKKCVCDCFDGICEPKYEACRR